MKFIKEKLSLDYILRRIREEDAKSDRRVTEVILTPSEWHEFICSFDYDRMLAPAIREYVVPICEPASPGDGLCGPRRVTIKRGAP